ncbi:hypothetical protein IP86_17500 [Rhodopseudomonas sp. AAP120]|uniref:hypothetical protein n=1 Tax=Rhodopseudomonas TaxID=1073 RepID=UPI0002D2BEAC|nr:MULTISPECIES: hypothetical protein [Rhodopseudomonas]KPF96205.1 hypothetical protein IP86_17500 [Rhodopseudomonas sp. AAP120]
MLRASARSIAARTAASLADEQGAPEAPDALEAEAFAVRERRGDPDAEPVEDHGPARTAFDRAVRPAGPGKESRQD